jgi:RHS repeat-associated protein
MIISVSILNRLFESFRKQGGVVMSFKIRNRMNTAGACVLFCLTVLMSGMAIAAQPTASTSTLLPDGRYLVAGGESANKTLKQMSIYDANSQKSTAMRLALQMPRKNHSATVLPDGTILILGGTGQDGYPVASAELIDAGLQKIQTINSPGLIARSQHRATLLTDGKVLITGGLSAKGGLIAEAELWNPKLQQAEALHAKLLTARYNHIAQLLADSPVLIEGGQDAAGKTLTSTERFDDLGQRFEPADGVQGPNALSTPVVAEIIPPADGFDVAVDSWIVVRFNKPLKIDTLNTATVSLLGPNGLVPINVVATEAGMLLFVSPLQQLLPATKFTLFIKGATDTLEQALPFTASSFTTASLPASGSTIGSVTVLGTGESVLPAGNPVESLAMAAAAALDDDEIFVVGPQHRNGHWRTGRPLTREVGKLNNELLTLKGPLAYEHKAKQYRPKFARNKAVGLIGVTGQVFRLNDRPLANVSVSIGQVSTQTDNQGYFTLTNVPSGRQELFVDGEKAGGQGKRYGKFVIGIDVDENGKAPVPPIFLPRVRDTDWIPVPSPITKDLVLTHPNVPGMEIHIPKGAVLRERDGKLVRKLALVPIPLDRMPFAFPENAPVYVSVQPGGLVVQGLTPQNSSGIHVIYPNFSNEPAGGSADFWRYEAKEKGWSVYGRGHASADGKQIIPDPGVAVYDTIGFMYTPPPNGPPAPPDGPNPCGQNAADPVSCGSGLFMHLSTDLAVTDVLPISIDRLYRQNDSVVRAFGYGTSHPYNMYLLFPTALNYSNTVSLVDSSGWKTVFTRTSPGSDMAGAVYDVLGDPGAYFQTRITYNSPTNRWILKTKEGKVFEFSNSAGMSLVAMNDRNGNGITITRAGGLIQRLSTASGRFIDFNYDASNRISSLEDNVGNVVSYAYAAGYLSSVTYPDGKFEEYTYDTAGHMLTVKDRRGNIMATNEYDASGRVVKQTLTDGGIYQFAYTLNGSGKITQTEVTDPRGFINRYTFNTVGVLTQKVEAVGQVEQRTTTYEREAVSNLLLSVTDNAGRKTAYTYDAIGNNTGTTRLAGTAQAVSESYTYEPVYNQIATYTDALGHTTSYSYDSQGNLTQIADPLLQQTKISYNAAGQVTRVEDPLGNISQTVYDNTDLINTADALGRNTGYFVDSLGRVTAVTDPLNKLTQIDYDNLSRVVKRTNALSGRINYSYDGNGNLLSLTDPKGNATQYTYDGRNRMLTTKDPLLNVSSNVYDLNGNVKQVIDRKGQVTTTTYDGLNRPITVTYADGSTISYAYDAAGRLFSVTDSNTGQILRTYDDFDRLLSETNSRGSVSYTYDAAGRRTSMNVMGQTVTNYSYDNAGRLTEIVQGSKTVSFTYDAAGRTTSITLPNGILASYTYDAANQLTAIQYTKGVVLVGDLTYAYDLAGRRIQMGGSLAQANLPANMVATYDAANRLMQFNARSLSYDANGNLLNDGNKGMTWNARDQLTGLSTGASFSYDASGRRLGKTVSGVTTGYMYDGINPVQEFDSVGTTKADLLSGGVDQFFARTVNGVTSSFITDALGSTLGLTDATGTFTTQYGYEAYGNSTPSGLLSDNPFQYTGRENDETGLYYYRARYYDPELPRFISSDPIGFAGGINQYTYVEANPVSKTDPLGLEPQKDYPARRLRSCNSEEYGSCMQQCSPRPVDSCKVPQTFKITGLKGGLTGRGWVDGPMSCSCQEPQDGSNAVMSCNANCKKVLTVVRDVVTGALVITMACAAAVVAF